MGLESKSLKLSFGKESPGNKNYVNLAEIKAPPPHALTINCAFVGVVCILLACILYKIKQQIGDEDEASEFDFDDGDEQDAACNYQLIEDDETVEVV